MSSLSQAASSVEKRTNARYWDSGDVVYRHILQLRRPRYAFDCRFGNGQILALIPWEWAMCWPLWAYVIGQIPGGWSPDRFGSNASTSGRSLSGRCLPCCKASSISLVDSALSLPCLLCASWSGLLKRLIFPRQQSHCCGLVSCSRRKGNGGVDF